jgi:putative membrane protein
MNVYPLEVSLGWVILKYLSFCLATIITQAFLLPQILVILLTPLILVSLDFVIDPVAVNISKSWQWEKGSRYFGIPLRNFLGWYIVGFLATLIFALIVPERQVEFNLLYLLPIILYGAFTRNSLIMFKLDKKMAIIGTIPAVTWTLLSLAGLVILFFA